MARNQKHLTAQCTACGQVFGSVDELIRHECPGRQE